MSRLAKAWVVVLPALLLLVAESATAEYCLNYSKPVQGFVAQHGGSGTRACWPTQEACEAYQKANQYDAVHKYDFSGGCYQSGAGSSSSGSGKGTSNSFKNAFKQTLATEIVAGILGAALNPPPPKGGQGHAQPAAGPPAPTQQQIDQQIQAQKMAQEAAYSADQQRLLRDLKGDIAVGNPNVMTLKAPPEPSASRQLGLLDREGHQAGSGGKRSDWENPPKNLPAAVLPKVPEPPTPVSAEGDVKGGRSPEALLKDLLGQVTTSRQKVDRLDQEVKQLEETVVREEKKAATENNADDEALRKAREALQRAKENREKTAAELRRLEEQAASARASTESTVTPP
jgi:hypothetical protein